MPIPPSENIIYIRVGHYRELLIEVLSACLIYFSLKVGISNLLGTGFNFILNLERFFFSKLQLGQHKTNACQ